MLLKYHPNLLHSDIGPITKQGWYLQRFDGCPYFLGLISQAELTKEKRKLKGGEGGSHACWFKDGVGDWLIEKNDINRISELLFRKSFELKKITNKKIIKHLNDMEKNNQLIKINLPGLTGKKWYLQQGDGCLFTFATVASPYTIKEKRRPGGEFSSVCLFFKDDLGSWYHDWDDLYRISGQFVHRAQAGEGAISKKLMQAWAVDEGKFFAESKKLDKIDFSKLTNQRLKKLFVDYVNYYLKAVSSSSLIDGFALGTDETLQKEITRYLESIGQTENKNRYFTALTAPTTQSFINEAEVSLLNVGLLIQSTPKFLSLLRQSVKQAAAALAGFPKIKKALATHTKNYFWVKNNYFQAIILTPRDFLEEIRGIILGGVDMKKERERILNTPREHKKAKARIIKEINLPKYLRILLTISEDFTYWQDERKKKTFWMDHYGTLFLMEIARRTGYTLGELKYLVYPEVMGLLSGHPSVTRLEVKKRQQACLYYQKGEQYEIISGPEALALKRKLFDEKIDTQVNDFRGMPASRGKVRGPVKVVMSVNELNKINKGDILVAVMTRPDYVAGIKKAAAIITDEGGVTCHAAIISRELGIPCVIGTKIATKVLKDGDEVDVNANHGVITVIKRK